jgi:OOP family OmpA-OmpF porin
MPHLPRNLHVSLVAALVGLAACGPIVFEDTSAIPIAGDPPPLPPPKEPDPPPPPKRVELRDNKIVINEKIQFEFNKARILPASDDLLEEIAKVIKENAQIKKIRIEGHSSDEGNDKYNLKLSQKRAEAVMKHLVDKGGIAKEILVAEGKGESQPLDSSGTDEGREKNRRVEFHVTEQEVTQKKVEIDPATGKENVVAEEKKTVNQ